MYKGSAKLQVNELKPFWMEVSPSLFMEMGSLLSKRE